MANYYWRNFSGQFSGSGNWNLAGAPGPGDSANFYPGSAYTVTGPGTASSINVSNGAGNAAAAFAGNFSADNYVINGDTTLASGSWTVTGNSGNISVAGDGIAVLTINGTVTSTASLQPTGFGLYIGVAGNNQSGRINSGFVSVNGPAAHLDTGVNGALLGQLGTEGALNVTAGASASFSGDSSGSRPALGVGLSGYSSVGVFGDTASNTVSSVVANGYVYIGHGNGGALSVSNLGTFTGGAAASGATPALGITIGDGSATLDAAGTVGNTTLFGGTGTASVYYQGTLTSLGDLRVGYDGSQGRLEVNTSSTATSGGQIMVGGGADHASAVGTVVIQSGGTVRSGGAHASGVAGVVLGSDATTSGTITISGTGSVLDANGDRITIADAGRGALSIGANGTVRAGSAAYSDREAAFAVAASVQGSGTVVISGAGAQLVANGDAVIGGSESNGAVTRGGTAVVTVTSGGLLQAAFMTVLAGSSVTVDASSTLTVPTILIDGGSVTLNSLAGTTIMFGDTGLLGLTALSGDNAITTFKSGDKIDLLGITNATLSNNVVTVGSATLSLSGAQAGATYALSSDGHGGTFVTVSAANASLNLSQNQTPIVNLNQTQTPILNQSPAAPAISRFFSSIDGGHFFTNDPTEIAALTTSGSSSYRPDLKLEAGGFGAINAATARADPNSTSVYRFFDSNTGAHFFTSSTSERDSITNPLSSNYQPNYVYEPGSTFYEHVTKQAGDIAVYRFFNSADGTHFYTGNQNEYNQITAKDAATFRPDLISEGVAFYAPANMV